MTVITCFFIDQERKKILNKRNKEIKSRKILLETREKIFSINLFFLIVIMSFLIIIIQIRRIFLDFFNLIIFSNNSWALA